MLRVLVFLVLASSCGARQVPEMTCKRYQERDAFLCDGSQWGQCFHKRHQPYCNALDPDDTAGECEFVSEVWCGEQDHELKRCATTREVCEAGF